MQAEPLQNAPTKPILNVTHRFNNCSHLCAYCCAQLSYTIQPQAVPIIFTLRLQTIITAHMLSIGGDGVLYTKILQPCRFS